MFDDLTKNKEQRMLTRRDLLKNGTLALVGSLAVSTVTGSAQAMSLAMPGSGAYKLSFHNQHTGENFNGTYRVGNRYLPDAFEDINYALRDFRTGESFPIDPRVIDILYLIHEKSDTSGPFEVLSGYRSPKTNAMLSRNSEGVAKNSLHMTGQAIDVRLPGYSTWGLRKIAASLRAGGVGYYKNSNFVHLDTGRYRLW